MLSRPCHPPEDLFAYRSAPIEFCEVASMGMEAARHEYSKNFIHGGSPSRPAQTSWNHRRDFPWIATVDAFQALIYSHPDIPAERTAAWLELMDSLARGRLERLWSSPRQLVASAVTSSFCTHFYIDMHCNPIGALHDPANKPKRCRIISGLSLGVPNIAGLICPADCRFDSV